MRIDQDKVVLVEPTGGFMFLERREVSNIPTPSLDDIICALCGTTMARLKRVEDYCKEPKTGNQIAGKFESIQPWVLRRIGVLKDVGRVERKIVSVWNGYDWQMAEQALKQLAEVPTREFNDPK